MQEKNNQIKEAFKTKDGVSQEDFENDINNSEKIKYCYQSDYVYQSSFSLRDYDIINHQKMSSKKGHIKCKTHLSNMYFNVTANAVCDYVYNDIAGWVLEDLTLDIEKIIPTSLPEKELVLRHHCFGQDEASALHTFDIGSEEKIIVYSYYEFPNRDLVELSSPMYANDKYRFKIYSDLKTECIYGKAKSYMAFHDNEWQFEDGNDYYQKIEDNKTYGSYQGTTIEYFDRIVITKYTTKTLLKILKKYQRQV